MAVREQWDGGAWQEHCCRLLGMKYGEDIQFIPDRTDGDGGMEAYRLDDGIVYQCYVPEDVFTTRAQTEAQKKKIRDDIHKIVSKESETVALLGLDYRIRRWVLLTPEYDDKEIVSYSRTKSSKIRTHPRPSWCHDEFQIVVSSDRDLFPAEMTVLYGLSNGAINLDIPFPAEDEVYRSIEGGLVDTLTAKLEVNPGLAASDEDLAGYRSETLMDYVYGKRQLDLLQDKYSLAYEAIVRRSNSMSRNLVRRMTAEDGGPRGIESIMRELSEGFRHDAPALSSLACEGLARYYLASWWISCPLRFKVTG